MPFTIVRQDITRMNVDAIVNAANPQLAMGGGVCGAIFNAAGPELLQAACDKVAPIETGGAAITPGFALPAQFVIHAAGPVYHHQNPAESERLLRSAYTESLALAAENDCASIAFPLISSGIFGYPKADALRVATCAIRDFLETHDMDVYLAIFDQAAFELSEQLLGAVESYIDQHYVDEHFVERPSLVTRVLRPLRREAQAAGAARVAASISTTDEERTANEEKAEVTNAAAADSTRKETSEAPAAVFNGAAGETTAGTITSSDANEAEAIAEEATFDGALSADFLSDFGSSTLADIPVTCADAAIAESSMLAFDAAPAPTGLDAVIENLDEPFNATLLRLIDAKGKTDVEVYKRANISRKLFSKIRTGKGYTPGKRTIIALAIALELTLEEANDLLERAGYTLSHSQLFDVIVEFFIVRGKYDIFEINEVLFKYDQPLLGAS